MPILASLSPLSLAIPRRACYFEFVIWITHTVFYSCIYDLPRDNRECYIFNDYETVSERKRQCNIPATGILSGIWYLRNKARDDHRRLVGFSYYFVVLHSRVDFHNNLRPLDTHSLHRFGKHALAPSAFCILTTVAHNRLCESVLALLTSSSLRTPQTKYHFTLS